MDYRQNQYNHHHLNLFSTQSEWKYLHSTNKYFTIVIDQITRVNIIFQSMDTYYKPKLFYTMPDHQDFSILTILKCLPYS